MWAAPLPPRSWTSLSGGGSRDHGLRDEQGARDFDHRLAAVHGPAAQPLEGLVPREAEARHQRALGALDHLPVRNRFPDRPGLATALVGYTPPARLLRTTPPHEPS